MEENFYLYRFELDNDKIQKRLDAIAKILLQKGYPHLFDMKPGAYMKVFEDSFVKETQPIFIDIRCGNYDELDYHTRKALNNIEGKTGWMEKQQDRNGKDIVAVYMIASQEDSGKPDRVARIGTVSRDDTKYALRLIHSSKEEKEVIYFTGLDKSISSEISVYGIHKYSLADKESIYDKGAKTPSAKSFTINVIDIGNIMAKAFELGDLEALECTQDIIDIALAYPDSSNGEMLRKLKPALRQQILHLKRSSKSNCINIDHADQVNGQNGLYKAIDHER
jgi:hypothetical protein